MSLPIFLTSGPAFLVSFVKPLLMFVTFLPWAWLISSKLDKDARVHHLNAHMFNGIHLACGLGALAAMLVIPLFFVGWPVGIVILAAPIYVYWQIRDRSVPEDLRFSISGAGFTSKLATRKQSRAARGAVIKFLDSKGVEHDVPVKEDPRFTSHLLAEDVIGPALEARATQIDLVVTSGGSAITQTVDGIRFKREQSPPDAAMSLVDYLKSLAGLDVDDRRRRQSAEIKLIGPSGEVQLSIATSGSSKGQEIRLVFDRSRRLLKPFDSLGLLSPQLRVLRELAEVHQRHGIVLIGAAPGQGLSTSAYSFVGRHDAYTSNIKTLEGEILSRIDGVDHLQWDPTNPDVDFATNLQSILRRDPDIVLVGRVTEAQAAKVAAEAGMEGPLIYITQRSNTIAGQLREWVRLVGDLKLATSSLRVVTNQRLLRTLCPNCRQAYQPTRERLKKMNLPADRIKQLYQASGKVQVKNKIEECPVCGGPGYLGQTGAFEVMLVDDDARRHLVGGDLKSALSHARRNKMIYLQEAALSKVVAGETTIEEVIRVTASARGNAEAAPRRPAADPAPAT